MDIRLAQPEDLLGMQACNLQNLPENYQMRYFGHNFHVGKPLSVGMELITRIRDEEAENAPHGHVTSISVLRGYRRLGIAKRLMLLSQRAMSEVYRAEYVSLHVRKSNRAAIGLYRDTLGFHSHQVEKGYYADGEDAYAMRLEFLENKGLHEKKTEKEK
ncbi:N-terminal acetyltransferase A complex catalytic subunit ard1 [Serendipita sp. 405]|nr:N-terminal acetyltransferase A complex catalytic subunit ard1 [Serendipita sp. 405]